MSLFTNFEKTATVYHPTDSNSTKKTSYQATGYNVKMFIITRTAEGSIILGDEVGDFVANVKKTDLGLNELKEGDKVVWDDKTYFIVNKPKYLGLFNSYKILLRQ